MRKCAHKGEKKDADGKRDTRPKPNSQAEPAINRAGRACASESVERGSASSEAIKAPASFTRGEAFL